MKQLEDYDDMNSRQNDVLTACRLHAGNMLYLTALRKYGISSYGNQQTKSETRNRKKPKHKAKAHAEKKMLPGNIRLFPNTSRLISL